MDGWMDGHLMGTAFVLRYADGRWVQGWIGIEREGGGSGCNDHRFHIAFMNDDQKTSKTIFTCVFCLILLQYLSEFNFETVKWPKYE